MDTTLTHHGIIGQKWGVRRFQNANGGLTKEGKERYSEDKQENKESKSIKDKANEIKTSIADKAERAKETAKNKWEDLDDNQKKAAKIGAAVVASLLLLHGATTVSHPKGRVVSHAPVVPGHPEYGMRPVYDWELGM